LAPWESRLGVAFGNTQFVSVGYDEKNKVGLILNSADGVDWTRNGSFATNTLLLGVELSGAAFGNNRFVAGGEDWSGGPGTVLTSPDGLVWSMQNSTLAPGTIAFCNDRFLMTDQNWPLGESSEIAASPDGTSWTHVPSQGSGSEASLVDGFTFGDGRFVAVGDSGAIWQSANGVLWTNRSQVTRAYLSDVTYGNNQFVAVGQDLFAGTAATVTSPDGIRWSDHSLTNAANLLRVVSGNGRFVAVGDGILSSLDGAAWSRSVVPAEDALADLAYGNGTFISVGASEHAGVILSSADGVAWTPQPSSVTNGLHAVAYGEGQFVAAGAQGVILTSPDGLIWTRRTSGTADSIDHIAYGSGRFVAITAHSNGFSSDYRLVVSTDGVGWSALAKPILSNDYSAITYGNGQFIFLDWSWDPLVGDERLASPDGITWRQMVGPGRGIHGFAFGNYTWIAEGVSGTILQSGPFVTLGLTPNAGNGLLTLSITGAAGLPYTIQSSADLISWQSVTNFTPAQPTTTALEGISPMGGQTFYRALSPGG
jgi:hypothetical protein